MKNFHFKIIFSLILAVIFVGAGCSSNKNTTSNVDQSKNVVPAVDVDITSTGTTVTDVKVDSTVKPKTVTTVPKNDVVVTPTPVVETPKPATVYNKAEVAKHNNSNDCWVVVDGQIYNVTNYIPNHPAGPEAIIKNCGKDATTIFNLKHDAQKKQYLSSFFVAKLQ